jgi:hypothetical protein
MDALSYPHERLNLDSRATIETQNSKTVDLIIALRCNRVAFDVLGKLAVSAAR